MHQQYHTTEKIKIYSESDEFDLILINVTMFPANLNPYIPVCKVRAIVCISVIS